MKLFLFTSLLLFIACTQEKTTFTFSDFIEINKIEKVQMHNYSGSFELNESQFQQFKTELGRMKYKPNSSYKLGAISFKIFINGKNYSLTSNSKSSYVEVPNSCFTKKKIISDSYFHYFETVSLNIQNYHPE